ncbi:DUF1800 domain-containing protein [uncultured Maribacter sp.]|uniref:DUF1800 domain-containing protein n=1 Tax=uncultured Maribacter sp. TaxID=431308 RepID=UPI0026392F8B|nr:DUF1800 domain-containing protein [uncultured Maribacter sp.]
MEYFINCNTSSFAVYTGPIDYQKAAHLYRRLGFSASIDTINTATTQSASNLVDALVDQALNTAPTTAPTWADWNNSNYPADDDAARQLQNSQRQEWRLAYSNDMLDNNLKERMSFFWSNHFVTEIDIYECNSFLYHYTNCLQRNALGNFKTFVEEIGLTNAMLYYLDGVFNNGNNPNENYARELYELFTLGEGNNYTEEDIIETARALTGYVERGELGCEPVQFDPTKHDAGTKTIFGQTDTFDYQGVIDNLFAQRSNEIAEFICRKLYEFFVHPDSRDAANNAQTIIDGMATVFITNNFEIAPVLRQLFKSQHFFDDEAVGVIIKSPFDLYFNLFKETNFTITDTNVSEAVNYSSLLGQTLFEPFDVAGWQRDRSWINTNFMIGRWLTIETILLGFYDSNPEQFKEFGIQAADPGGITTNDPAAVATAIVDKILPKGLLTQADYDTAIGIFRGPYEDNGVYEDSPDPNNFGWNMNLENTPTQVYLLLQHLGRQPEFQLK